MSLLNWLPKKKKPSQLYSAYARIVPLCMCDSREELFGNKAPRRQTPPLSSGDETGMGWMLFQIAFPQNIFPTYHFVFFFFMQYFPWCRREFNLEQIITLNATYIWDFHVWFLVSCSDSFEGLGDDDCNGPTLISSHFAKIKCKCIHEPWWHHVEPKSNNSLFIIIIVICIEDRCWGFFFFECFISQGFFFQEWKISW